MSNSTNSYPTEFRSILASLLCLTLFLSLPACIKDPVVVKKISVRGAHVPVERPEGVNRLPIRIGSYYSEEFRAFNHEDYTVGSSKLLIPVGSASATHFNEVFAAMFERSVEVSRLPPYRAGDGASNLSAVIEVRLESFSYDWRPLNTGPFTARVEYRFIVYSPTGQTIASWVESGSDTRSLSMTEDASLFTAERTDNAMRTASSKFMSDFERRPQVARWLAGLEPSPASSDTVARSSAGTGHPAQPPQSLDGVRVESTLYSQTRSGRQPFPPDKNTTGVLVAHVIIRNSGEHTILVRASDVTLRPRPGVTLRPISVNRVTERLYQAPQTEDSEVVGVLVNPALGAMMTLGEGSEKDSARKRIFDFIEAGLLEDATVGPAGSVEGFVYFEALGIDAKFDQAELRVRFGEASSVQNYDATLWVGKGPVYTDALVLASAHPAAETLSAEGADAPTVRMSPVQQRERVRPENLTIALLPADGWTMAGGSRSSTTEHRIHEFARTKVTDEGFELVDRSEEDAYYRGELWTGGHSNKTLNVALAVVEGKKYAADGVLTFKYIVRGIGGGYIVDIDVAVVDVETGRVFSRSGRASDTRVNTESVLDEFLAASRVVAMPSRAPMPRAESAANSPAKTQEQSALKVAILPPAFLSPTLPSNGEKETEIYNQVRRYLHSKRGLEVQFDYADRNGPGALNTHEVWQGSVVRKEPDEARLHAVAEQLGVDVIVMAWISGDRGASALELYVFEVATDNMLHETGGLADSRELVERTFASATGSDTNL